MNASRARDCLSLALLVAAAALVWRGPSGLTGCLAALVLASAAVLILPPP